MDGGVEAGVVQLGRNGPQASGQVPQAPAPGQLGEGHGAELLGAAQAAHAAVAIVAVHDPRERLPRQKLHDLGEEGLASTHTETVGKSRGPRRSRGVGSVDGPSWLGGFKSRTPRISRN